MTQKPWLLLVLALFVVVIAVGCGSSPTTPTKPAVSPTAIQVTVVITATPPPPTATSAASTLTPIPTLAATPTVPATTGPTARPTAVPKGATATRRPATATAPAAPATATSVPVAIKYPAPVLIGPVFDPGLGRRDERHSPADALVFEWQSVGPLGQGECYAVRVDFNPGQGDTFLQCGQEATQVAQARTAKFTLNQPTRGGPNYSALLSTQAGESNVSWHVTVVRDDGPGGSTGALASDATRHNFSPLSPRSRTYTFILKGGN